MTFQRPVMPTVPQLLAQAFPSGLMALSIATVLALGTLTPLGVPVWAAGLFLPTVVLALLSGSVIRRPWRQAALIHLATMAIVFPVLVVRQSIVRIPFVDGGNGTLMPPVVATVAVVIVLAILAVACAVLAQEDPEYSGIVFLPAAMMVPILAGQSDLVSLSSGLLIAAAVFGVSAILSMLASMLPPAMIPVIAPAAIACEFLLLTAIRSDSIFPVGAGNTAKVLFFTVVASTVALAIIVPILSGWVRQVTRMARAFPQA